MTRQRLDHEDLPSRMVLQALEELRGRLALGHALVVQEESSLPLRHRLPVHGLVLWTRRLP